MVGWVERTDWKKRIRDGKERWGWNRRRSSWPITWCAYVILDVNQGVQTQPCLPSTTFVSYKIFKELHSLKRLSHFYSKKTHYRPFNTKSILNMPLVDPVTNSAGGDKTAQWQNKLVGKKIGETSDAVVCLWALGRWVNYWLWQTFAKSELPQETRVIEPGMMVTKDFKPDRWVSDTESYEYQSLMSSDSTFILERMEQLLMLIISRGWSFRWRFLE